MTDDPTTNFDASILYIDEQNLRGEYAELARTLKVWLDVKATASDRKRVAKLTLNRTKKAVELALRSGPTKMTDKAVEAEVESDPLVTACADELLRSEYLEDRAQAVVDSLKTKRTMLMMLGGLARTEIEVDQFTS